MAGKFEYFVIFAEMRTGSNFLEESLNEYPGLKSYGEVFNPHFIGQAKKTELMGMSMADREADPQRLIGLMKRQTDGLPGFRFFNDHDPRIKTLCLTDAACAKIVLTRNPLDSYVSREIARQTGQWRLGEGKAARTAAIRFDPQAFRAELTIRQSFQQEILHGLQVSGQTAFYLDYDDIGDVGVLNGLASFLGLSESRTTPSAKTKKQNPQSLAEKVVNYDEMIRSLETIDFFNLSRTPNFEPRRGPAVPTVVAAAKSPLLFVPIKGGPFASVTRWMAELDDVEEDRLSTGFTQQTLRQWKRKAKAHQTFAVLRHPVVRLHAAFARHILIPGPDCYSEIRETLRHSYDIDIPDGEPGAGYDAETHRVAFLNFVSFVRANLAGQTSVRLDPAWASQAEILRGVNQFMIPNYVFREEDLEGDLGYLAERIGKAPAAYRPEPVLSPVPLADILDDELEGAVKAAYQKDYMLFGFDRSPGGQAA